jgi:diguanylate cyclase (GGDEF)-like protein/hemerythrin-like metal-binding protein
MLSWNEGMSVGVEALDNDHKKIIIIINAIAEAINSESTEQVINQVFNELEDYVNDHFTREEAFMQKISHDELNQHKQGHQDFIKKIPEFKSLLFRSESLEVIEKINRYLHDWIIHHILIEDMAYSHSAHIYQEKHKTHFSPLKMVSEWLNAHIKLSKRFIISAIFPVIGLLSLSFIILNENYQQYKTMISLSEVNQIILQINQLSHNLQTERGLSTGYISSQSPTYFQQLLQHRKSTDKTITLYLDQLINLSNFFDNIMDKREVNDIIQQLETNLLELKQQRKKIDQKHSNFEQLHQYYSQLINHLLDISNSLIKIKIDSQLDNNISAINAVLNIKEVTGQERALGTLMIERAVPDPQLFQRLSSLKGRKEAALKHFHYTASEKQQEICHLFCQSTTADIFSDQLFINLQSGNPITLSSQQWFGQMSEKINHLKMITEQLINELNYQTEMKLTQLNHKFYLVLFILSLFLLLTSTLLFLLNYSIITPIQRITQVLTALTSGDKSQQIYQHQFNQDEIGDMFTAYETLRRNLLQADITEHIINGQEQYLQYRIHENAHYRELASIDSLTGALNRRKFNEIIIEEITKAQQHHADLSIMLLDIDHFKRINDNYGHTNGDLALQIFYQLCYRTVRFSDIVVRIGGEEFIILMPDTKLTQAAEFAEKIRKTVDNSAIDLTNATVHLTVSIGVTQWHNDLFKNANDFVDYADQAMYEAKQLGRNRVLVKNKK